MHSLFNFDFIQCDIGVVKLALASFYCRYSRCKEFYSVFNFLSVLLFDFQWPELTAAVAAHWKYALTRKSNSIVHYLTRLWSLISTKVLYGLCSTQRTHQRKRRIYFTVGKTIWTVRLINWTFTTDESLSEVLFQGNCFWNIWPRMICWPTPVKYSLKISTSTNLFVEWISPRQFIVSL